MGGVGSLGTCDDDADVRNLNPESKGDAFGTARDKATPVPHASGLVCAGHPGLPVGQTTSTPEVNGHSRSDCRHRVNIDYDHCVVDWDVDQMGGQWDVGMKRTALDIKAERYIQSPDDLRYDNTKYEGPM